MSGSDDVADAEERVVARVALVEVVLGVGHERGRAQRVADLVDVLGLEVLEDRDRPDEEVLAPVGRQAGVDASVRVGADVGEQSVDLGFLLRVGARLQPDVRGVVPVVGVECAPGRRQHDDERDDAHAGDEAASDRFGHPLAPLLGHEAHRRIEHEPSQEHDADARQQYPRELHAHLEAPDEDVAAAGQDAVQRPERGAPERHEQGHEPDAHQGTARHAGAPAPDAHRDADADEDGQRPASARRRRDRRRRATRAPGGRRTRSQAPWRRAPGCGPPSGTGRAPAR